MSTKAKQSETLSPVERQDVTRFASGKMTAEQSRILAALERAGENGLTKREYAIGQGYATAETYKSGGVSYDRFNRNCRILIAAGLLPERETAEGGAKRYFAANSKEYAASKVLPKVDAFVSIGNARTDADAFAFSHANYEHDTANRKSLLALSGIDKSVAVANVKRVISPAEVKKLVKSLKKGAK